MTASTIILLEDDELLQQYFLRHLEAAGHTVIAQSNSKGILHLVETHKPALIITDMVMPDAEGLEAIFQLIENSNIPIIAVSAFPEYLDIASDLVTRCLQKPITGEQLTEEVRQILDRT